LPCAAPSATCVRVWVRYGAQRLASVIADQEAPFAFSLAARRRPAARTLTNGTARHRAAPPLLRRRAIRSITSAAAPAARGFGTLCSAGRGWWKGECKRPPRRAGIYMQDKKTRVHIPLVLTRGAWSRMGRCAFLSVPGRITCPFGVAINADQGMIRKTCANSRKSE